VKFLCEQCKAKYQIDDSKVAGKTVRMKCRKCGHLIEVRAEVTETSVASGLPREPSDETKVGAPDPAVLAAQKQALTPRPGVTPPQKPQGQKLATSLASAKPQAPKPAANPSALAGAFQKSVQKSDDALLELSTTAEWYVAINGVPVGPIRLTELRRKAASGAVNEESLCWQEGLEEWRPLKTFTELASLVREAAQSARPSLANPPPDASLSHTPPPATTGPAPSGGAPSRAPSRPVGPSAPASPRPDAKPAPMAARSNVVSLSSRLATAEKLADPLPEPEEHTVISDPFAPIAPQPVSAPASADASSPVGAFAPIATAAAAPSAPIAPLPADAAPAKKGPNWIAIAMVVLAAAFGVTAAIAIFFRSNQNSGQQVTTVYLSATTNAPTATTATAATTTTAEPTTSVAPTTSGSAVAIAGTARVPSGNGGNGGSAAATTTSTATAANTSIAALLGGPATGPNVGSGTGGGTTGGGLSDKAVQDAVRNYTPGVKRTCWERGGSAESTAIVDVTVTVAPNGNVSGAQASGNDPVVAKCIENQVRNWHFSPPGETTTIKIPFKFLKQ
jgi:predicted Zn finger-like uncharacterized protein